jgi:putative transposase
MKRERPKDIGRACLLLKTSRSAFNYRSIKNDNHLIDILNNQVINHPVEGFWKSYSRIRKTGEQVNHKRLHRVYCKMGLPLRRKVKKRITDRVKEPLEVPNSFSKTWSIDFMSDSLEGGKKFKTFNVIDDFNREVLFIETDYSIKSSRVVWVLKHLINRYGKPQKIRMDNGPEFIADLTKKWSTAMEIEFKYIQPGKPMQNAFIERFNKSFRQGVLDAYLFSDIEEVRQVTEEWVYDFNNHRPHDALGGLSPIEYRRKYEKEKSARGLRSASAEPQLHSALSLKNN